MALTLPPDLKLNRDVPLHVEITSPDEEFFANGSASFSQNLDVPSEGPLKFAIPIAKADGMFKLQVSLTYFYCRVGDTGLCRTGGVVWSGRCNITNDGDDKPISLSHTVTR